MATMTKKTTRKSRTTGQSSKARSSGQGLAPARRPMPVEAPDRGHLIEDREAPETREVRRVEAPDAGYGVPEPDAAEY